LWLLRLGLAVVVAVGVVLVARVSVVAFGGGAKRLHRVEQHDDVRTAKTPIPAQPSR
jgi:hypothetical protein